MKKAIFGACTALAAMVAAGSAQAATIVLDFEGVGDQVGVNEFYNGGTDGAGNSGTNYGISFSTTSLGLTDADVGGSGNIANEPSGESVLFFLSGGAATMNVAAGFDTGFSFFYSGAFDGSVSVFDGLNGTGNLLATLNLPAQNGVGCTGDPNGGYCNWTNIGVAFSGIAQSVNFGGSANYIVFDDVTLGSVIAGGGGGAVPEPATWAMMLLGFGAIGFSMRRRKQIAALQTA